MLIFIPILLFYCPYSVHSYIQRPGQNPNYRWTVLPEVDNLDVCNSKTCLNTSHTMCRRKDAISSDCENFAMLPMEFGNIQKFVLIHNGLRNRIVRSKKSYAKNMNYLVRYTGNASQTLFIILNINLLALGHGLGNDGP